MQFNMDLSSLKNVAVDLLKKIYYYSDTASIFVF